MSYCRSLYIFRRDLRLEDNTALAEALALSKSVDLVFIFDPRQCQPHDYFSPKAFAFLRGSLDALSADIAARGGRLHFLYGEAEKVVEDVFSCQRFDALFINKDYTPFSQKRDLALKELCRGRGVSFHDYDDALLCPPGSVMKEGGGPYLVFTPFYRKALTVEIPNIQKTGNQRLSRGELKTSFLLRPGQLLEVSERSDAVPSGRTSALAVLRNLPAFKLYARQRDIPSLSATTRLSAHLKFGTVSVRECRQAMIDAFGAEHPLLRQLYWRDFFTHIAHHFPHVFGQAFYDEYDHIPWRDDPVLWQAWCDGKTGFPLVDAGMRELNATGFMHNRARMVAASFLVKDLGIDWRRGEAYFARHLVDYDPAVNNGNWQWAASTGCDHQPYFRIFNPVLQQKRFDPVFRYIRQWIPEFDTKKYLSPIIEHSDAAARAKALFKAVLRRVK